MALVVLDAGHGKETAGKRSPDSTFFEYEFNRDIANRIKNHLIRHEVDVVLTAPSLFDIPLSERCAISNKAKPSCFVSIHANAYGTDFNEANGWEIFIVGKGGNAEKIAKNIQKESSILGLKDRGIKVENFYVIKNTDAPAVLIEHGFYTNKTELSKLKNDEFKEKCAIADTKGILKYLNIPWIEPNNNHWCQGYLDELVSLGYIQTPEAWTFGEDAKNESVIALFYKLVKKVGGE